MSVSRSRLGLPDRLPGLDDRAGPALPLSAVDGQALVERIVERARAEHPGKRTRRFRAPWFALAAIVVAGSATATGIVVQRRAVPRTLPEEPPAVGFRSPEPAATRLRRMGRRPPPEVSSSAPAPSASVQVRPSPLPVEKPADRLGAANELRRAQRWREAEAAYLAVVTQAPAAPEAYVARLAAASLRLEHLGDPAGALRLYESSAPGGALGVEGLFGTARCHRALGQSAEESAALTAVVSRYPTSLQADRARQRLRELQGSAQPSPTSASIEERAP